MKIDKAQEIISHLDSSDKVLDVGGGISAFGRADFVIDILPYEIRSKRHSNPDIDVERYNADTWIQMDVCDRKPWPFKDKFFDFVVCSHLLEDVRDPVWVCAEIIRVGKAGYIETPSRIIEQSKGIEHPLYTGYYHHRWLISVEDGCLCFRHKPHSLHALRRALIANTGVFRRINKKYDTLEFEWKDKFEYKEIIEFDEDKVNDELCSFAVEARKIPDLLVSNNRTLSWKLKRFIYFQRLSKAQH